MRNKFFLLVFILCFVFAAAFITACGDDTVPDNTEITSPEDGGNDGEEKLSDGDNTGGGAGDNAGGGEDAPDAELPKVEI